MILLAAALSNVVGAQARSLPVSRATAIDAALMYSPRTSVARADSLAARALLSVARQWENPILAASYSESTPQAHLSLEFPIDWAGARSPRIAAARLGLEAASFRSAYARALLILDADTTYTRAQAFKARSAIAARSVRDADSLLTIARFRRDAGDASDLDVELATIFAAQTANNASADSVSFLSSRLILQSLMGISPDSLSIELSDSLEVASSPLGTSPASIRAASIGGVPTGAQRVSPLSLPVAAYSLDISAASSRLLAEQRRRFLSPAIAIGFESFNGGDTHGILPTVGFTLPLPFFNRNSAAILAANADVDRARAAFQLARLENNIQARSAQREFETAQARFARSRTLVASANRIASLSLLAYREGAATLSTALDAQRSARDALLQFIDDVASARISQSVLRLYTVSSPVSPP